MAFVFDLLRDAYTRVVPETVRHSNFVKGLKERLPHNLIYGKQYYAKTVEEPARQAAGFIAPSIVADLHPRTVVDVGCGTGALLEGLRNKGCSIFGLEYSEAGLEFCRSRKLDVRKFDLEQDALNVDRVFDVAISMEVAEHLPESCAERYIDLLTVSRER